MVAATADALLRDREEDAVARCEAAARAAVAQADRKQSFMADYLAPAFYSVPAEGGRESFYEMMAAQVSETVPLLQRAARTCDEADVLPWHGPLQERRATYADYLGARIAWARAVSVDGRLFYRDDEELSGLRSRAFPEPE